MGPSLRVELRHAAPWLALALVTWGAGVATAKLRAGSHAAERAPWQRSYLELSVDDQRLYRAIREGIFEAENRRAESPGKQWPAVDALAGEGIPPFAHEPPLPAMTWTMRRHGVYVNYVGEGAQLRWLVLFIEPEPAAFTTPGEQAPPVDEEHHTLSDGTALHVTVWTQPVSEPAPAAVLAFPVAEGWVQRVGR